MKHTISVLVENKFGVLARIAGLFSARGFNISALSVAETDDPTMSRMTIVVTGDDKILDQVKKQLNKLIDVIIVRDFASGEYIGKELAMIKVSSSVKTKPEILKIAKEAGALVLDDKKGSVILELAADEDAVRALTEKLRGFGIIELVRTGRVAISKDKE